MPNLNRTIACHGLSLQVPSDWNVAALSSQPGSGYLRLDDDAMPRLELKWAQVSGSPAADLPRIKKRYISSLRRSAKKTRSQLVVEELGQALGKTGKRGKNFISFRWKASQQGHTLISSCNSCGRQVLAQLYAPLDDNLPEIADAVFATFRDHPVNGWHNWSLYDFNFRVPADFQLLSQSLLLGRLEFAFQRKAERLIFSQWAVAQTQLAGKSLLEWFKTHLGARTQGFRLRTAETNFRGHPSLSIEGQMAGLKAVFRVLAATYSKNSPASSLRWRLWHCPQTNRLVSLQAILLPSSGELVDQLAQEIRCH